MVATPITLVSKKPSKTNVASAASGMMGKNAFPSSPESKSRLEAHTATSGNFNLDIASVSGDLAHP